MGEDIQVSYEKGVETIVSKKNMLAIIHREVYALHFSEKEELEDPDEGIYVFSVEAGERQNQRILYHEGEV